MNRTGTFYAPTKPYMPDKTQPIGTCDHCLGPIPPGQWRTRRGPRLYCSLECRNTANSRAGNPVRVQKLRQAVQTGTWQNPAKLRPPTPEEQSARSRKGRLREVAEGRWRNPALTPAARAKLSRPRKHSGPLASAIERLKTGVSMSGLTIEEADAYRSYARQRRAARRDAANAYHRQRYHIRQSALTDEQRQAQRQRWRAANRRRKANKPTD